MSQPVILNYYSIIYMHINNFYIWISSLIEKIEKDNNIGGDDDQSGGDIGVDGDVGVDGGDQSGGADGDDYEDESELSLANSYNSNKPKIIKLLKLYHIITNINITQQDQDSIKSLLNITSSNLDDSILALKNITFNALKKYLISYSFIKPPKNATSLMSFNDFVKKLGIVNKYSDFIAQIPKSTNASQLITNLKKVILTDMGLLYKITLTSAEINSIVAAFNKILEAEKYTFDTLELFSNGLNYLNIVKNLSEQPVEYNYEELDDKYEYLNDPLLSLKLYNQIYLETMWKQHSEYKKKKKEGELIKQINEWLSPQIRELSGESSFSQSLDDSDAISTIKTKKYLDALIMFLEQNVQPKKPVESKTFIYDVAMLLSDEGVTESIITKLFLFNLANKFIKISNNELSDVTEKIITVNVTNMPKWYLPESKEDNNSDIKQINIAASPACKINSEFIPNFKEFIIQENTKAGISKLGISKLGIEDIITNFEVIIKVLIQNCALIHRLITVYKYEVYLHNISKYIYVIDLARYENRYKFEPIDILFLKNKGQDIIYINEDCNYFITYFNYIADNLNLILTVPTNYLSDYDKRGRALFKTENISDQDEWYTIIDKKIYTKANIVYYMFITQIFNNVTEETKIYEIPEAYTAKIISKNPDIYLCILDTLHQYYTGINTKQKYSVKESFDHLLNTENIALVPDKTNNKVILDYITETEDDTAFYDSIISKYKIDAKHPEISKKSILTSYLYSAYISNKNDTAKQVMHEIILKFIGINSIKVLLISQALNINIWYENIWYTGMSHNNLNLSIYIVNNRSVLIPSYYAMLTDVINNFLISKLAILCNKYLTGGIPPHDTKFKYIYATKLRAYLSKDIISTLNKKFLPIKLTKEEIEIEIYKLTVKILRRLKINHLLFISNKSSIAAAYYHIIIKISTCYGDYSYNEIYAVKNLLVTIASLLDIDSIKDNSIISCITKILDKVENAYPKLSELKLKHYIKLDVDGSKELDFIAPNFVISKIPALKRILGDGIYITNINGGYRDFIEAQLRSIPRELENSLKLTNFFCIDKEGFKTAQPEFMLQLATELIYSELFPYDFNNYPLTYIYEYYVKNYFPTYDNVSLTSLLNAMVMADYYIIQQIYAISKIPMLSEADDDFITEYFELLDGIHYCYKILTLNVNKKLLRNKNLYDFIIETLEL